MHNRGQIIDEASSSNFDVAIVGGGINGACLYDRLCQQGYRTIILEKNDFASGTSQASGMMIWGGLLYLKNFDLNAVRKFSRSRDDIIKTKQKWVTPEKYSFIPAQSGILSKVPSLVALYVYWAMSGFKRRRPVVGKEAAQSDYLQAANDMLSFEEGELRPSDSRFVLHWITRHRKSESVPLNHAQLVSGSYSYPDKKWKLDVRDILGGNEFQVSARMVVNCAGTWTDEVNRKFDIHTPYKHIFSKGAYLLFDRSADRIDRLIFMMEGREDVITSLPWGPVEMWGPTEDLIDNLEEGVQVNREDVSFLMEQRQSCFQETQNLDDIVSVRCGVRPLPVPADYQRKAYPLNLSRSVQIYPDPQLPWISTYGGKLTGCVEAAARIEKLLRKRLKPEHINARPSVQESDGIKYEIFPHLSDPVPSALWCRENEYCYTLESYLRRRTNISQWVPRGGLGRKGEYVDDLMKISTDINHGDHQAAAKEVSAYETMIREQYDPLLS